MLLFVTAVEVLSIPHCPNSFEPQEYTSPDAAITIVCALPHATSTIATAVSVRTGDGLTISVNRCVDESFEEEEEGT